MNALTFSFQSLVHCAADISDTTEFSKSEPSQRKILENSVEDWQEELIPRVLGFESKYSYKDSNLAHFWRGDTDSEENWLARPRNEDMSQMHHFGGASDVILDDLGMFWRYLRMQKHSVWILGWTWPSIQNHIWVSSLFVSPRTILVWSPIWIAFCALLVWRAVTMWQPDVLSECLWFYCSGCVLKKWGMLDH